MGDVAAEGATCSWQSSLLCFDTCDDLSTAVARVESAVSARESVCFVSLSDLTAAPWISICLPRAVRGLSVACSARVLEVHAGAESVRTHEGLPAGDLFIHRAECNAAAGESVLLKFFARRPKNAIDVAALAVVCDRAEADNRAAAPCSGSGEGLAERVERLETLVHVSIGSIMQQLRDVEKRLRVLEADRNR